MNSITPDILQQLLALLKDSAFAPTILQRLSRTSQGAGRLGGRDGRGGGAGGGLNGGGGGGGGNNVPIPPEI